MSIRNVYWEAYCGWDEYDENTVQMTDEGIAVPADGGQAEVEWREASGSQGPTVEVRLLLATSHSDVDWYESECIWESDEWRCNGEEVELASPGSLPEVTCDSLESAL